MPLKGIPDSIVPELLFALAKMGHGDFLVIADANFPSDSIANSTVLKNPIRVHGTTSDILRDILTLMPVDQYQPHPVKVMDRVESDKLKNLEVPAYSLLSAVSGTTLEYVERFEFYEIAKKAFVVIQTNDRSLYANCIVVKGVL